MPELPEVEVICRGLRPHLIGHQIISLDSSGKNLRVPVPMEKMAQRLAGQRISKVKRRAKYLLIEAENRDLLIIHLGMSGTLGVFAADTIGQKHDHVIWRLDNDHELRLHDPRRFGSVQLLTPDEAKQVEKTLFKNVGPEPFSRKCSSAYLSERARSKTAGIKTFLMDGRIVAGIGNIYANESLFAAGIHPEQPAGTLDTAQWRKLHRLIRKILRHAINCGGSTISDFLDASGNRGYFQMNFKVYGKAGAPCPNCSTEISKKQVGGRAAYFCPQCQPMVL